MKGPISSIRYRWWSICTIDTDTDRRIMGMTSLNKAKIGYNGVRQIQPNTHLSNDISIMIDGSPLSIYSRPRAVEDIFYLFISVIDQVNGTIVHRISKNPLSSNRECERGWFCLERP